MLPESLESVARTIASVSPHPTPDATIRPPTATVSKPRPRSDEESLPTITLGGSAGGDAPGRADIEVVGVLGEGGLGRVMLAEQRSIGRHVAVKVARDREHGSAALRVEARTMGRLEHPNVVPVHAIGVDDEGGVVLVMKHIEGVDWRALLREPDHPWWAKLDIPPSERQSFHLDVLAQIANALHFAHARGVIHRDVKPENVLIGAHGDVYLADWGVASLPHERGEDAPCAVVGTPAYMAPEMVLGVPRHVDARSDVFLLGATLHEILVGKPRHPGRSTPQVLVAAFTCEPCVYPSTVPEELAALAQAATEREPSDRPESALAFRRALDEWRVHHGAIGLTQRARAVLAEARALRDAGGPEALADVDRLLVEARFGLTQALREWPEHRPAQQGLHDVLVLAVENDLARESLHAARAHLAELDEPPPALAEAVASLDARLAAEREERERLVAMERDLDFSVASRERRTFIGMVLASGLLVMASSLARFVWTGGSRFGSVEMVGVVAIALVPAIGFALAMRRRGTQNTAGAAFVNAVVMGMGAVLAHRVIAVLSSTPVHVILATDCVIYAVVLGSMRPLAPRVALLAPLLLLGALAIMMASRPALVFGFVLLVMLVVVYVRWSFWMQPATRDARPPTRPPSA